MNMNCEQTRQKIKTTSTPDLAHEPLAHIRTCEMCRHWYGEFKLDVVLQDFDVPEPDEALIDRLIKTASQSNPHRVFKTPRLAIAASIAVISMAFGLFLGQGRSAEISFEVAMAPYEDRMVEVVINAAQARDQAGLTISLAEDVELSGYPEKRVLKWKADLAEGKNLLSLPLRLIGEDDSYFTVRMTHGASEQSMRVNVRAKPQSNGMTSA
jgi:hypothetical protein